MLIFLSLLFSDLTASTVEFCFIIVLYLCNLDELNNSDFEAKDQPLNSQKGKMSYDDIPLFIYSLFIYHPLRS